MSTRTLRITSGPAAGESRAIDSELVIGREGADLTIDDSELSRRHVALRPVEGGVEVEDLGSLNGTFVNGEQISGALTLTASGTLEVGLSQATVEVSPPPPEATVARPIPASGAAKAQRPVPTPEVTVQRPVPRSEDTVQRPVQASDDTVQRPVGAAATPPAKPPKSKDRGERSGGSRRAAIIGAVLAVVVLIVIVVLLASGGEAATEKRRTDVTLRVAAITLEDARTATSTPGPKEARMVFSGTADGPPFGAGNVTLDIVRGASRPRRSIELTARATFRFDGGVVVGSAKFGPIRSSPDTFRFQGTARLLRGTGDFEGVKGTLKMTGERPNPDEAIEKTKLTGSVEY